MPISPCRVVIKGNQIPIIVNWSVNMLSTLPNIVGLQRGRFLNIIWVSGIHSGLVLCAVKSGQNKD